MSESLTRKIEALRRALSPIERLLNDSSIVEIMLNQDRALWIEKAGGTMEQAGEIDDVRAMSIIATIAALLDTTVTADRPILECELPAGSPGEGSRFEGLIPPLVSAPVFAIRKRATMIYTLADYVRSGLLAEEQKQELEAAIASRKNVLVAGGTGSGKTTFANAVLQAVATITPEHRILIIEDTPELQCSARNTVTLRTADGVDQTMLLRAAMRLRPDRIVVGEVRDKAALALLKAWNTGHPGGVATVHANGAAAALMRMDSLAQEAGVPSQAALIDETVDVVVAIERERGQRRVSEIVIRK